MPTVQVSRRSTATPEALFAAWTDVSRWGEVDGIESAEINGRFKVGATITSRSRWLPPTKLTITRVERPRLWTDETTSLGVRMWFDHIIEQEGEQTSITERATIVGPLGYLLAFLIKRRLVALFEASLQHVATVAEAAG